MSYLSNGTQGDLWMHRWCFRCVRDHGYSHVKEGDPGKGCPIIMRMMADEHPIPELVDHYEGGPWGPDHLECRMFEHCRCQDDGWEEPQPPPKPDPNQGLLFDVAPETVEHPMQVIMDRPVEETASL